MKKYILCIFYILSLLSCELSYNKNNISSADKNRIIDKQEIEKYYLDNYAIDRQHILYIDSSNYGIATLRLPLFRILNKDGRPYEYSPCSNYPESEFAKVLQERQMAVEKEIPFLLGNLDDINSKITNMVYLQKDFTIFYLSATWFGDMNEDIKKLQKIMDTSDCELYIINVDNRTEWNWSVEQANNKYGKP